MVERSIKEYFRGKTRTNTSSDPTNQLDFVPVVDQEFRYLLGLEEVVQFRLEMDKKAIAVSKKRKTKGRPNKVLKPEASSTPSASNHFSCVRCKTDVSCLWKQDEDSSVLCKSCFNCNWRKEHWTFVNSSHFSPKLPLKKIPQVKPLDDPDSSHPSTSKMSPSLTPPQYEFSSPLADISSDSSAEL